jgi:hydrogenase expression/formation protein HypC
MCLAVPGLIISIAAAEEAGWLRTGRVDFGGIVMDVNLACTPEAGVGDYVLVHVGVAISTIDATAAELTFEYLREIETNEVP